MFGGENVKSVKSLNSRQFRNDRTDSKAKIMGEEVLSNFCCLDSLSPAIFCLDALHNLTPKQKEFVEISKGPLCSRESASEGTQQIFKVQRSIELYGRIPWIWGPQFRVLFIFRGILKQIILWIFRIGVTYNPRADIALISCCGKKLIGLRVWCKNGKLSNEMIKLSNKLNIIYQKHEWIQWFFTKFFK